MASSMIRRLNIALQKFDQLIGNYFNGFPPALCAVDVPHCDHKHVSDGKSSNFLESLKNGFLLAVPVSRRSVERRRSRKYGFPKWVWKPFVPKTNILTCLNCGHHHLADTLCPNCYEKVKMETKQLQEQIESELGLKPVEKEVIVLYEGEKNDNFWKNQYIVEVPRKRPDWFHSNLMQSTTEKKGQNNNELNNTIHAKINND